MRGHRGNVLDLRVGVHDKAMVDVDDLFAEDGGRAFEGEVVQRGRDGPFERVLLRHHAELAFAAIDAVEHFVERGALEQVRLVDAEAGCKRARGFVGVGSGRAEVGEYGFG